jgi:hypothetical protein
MIVHTHEGAGLEVFWRHRGNAYWSYLTALRFLLRLRLDRSATQALRGLLAGRMSQGLAWNISEDEVLQRIATLISTGRIIVVENGDGKRWPDSGLVLRSGGQSFVLLCRDALFPARDMAEASRWIHKLQEQQQKIEDRAKSGAVPPAGGNKSQNDKDEQEAHTRAVENLRERLKTSSGADYAHLHEALFLAEIENAFRSGRLIPVYHPVSGHSETTEAAAPPPPVASLQSTPDRDDPEPVTFDPEHSGSTQAANLSNAAQNGVPFCEVCQKGAA